MATSTEKAIAKLIAVWTPSYTDSAWWGSGSSDPTDTAFSPGGRVLAFIQVSVATHTAASFNLGVTGGGNYYQAMACHALHWLTLAEREENTALGGNVSGPITSIRTGDESIGFQQSAMSVGGGDSDMQFKETTWGKRYLSMRDTRPDAHLFYI